MNRRGNRWLRATLAFAVAFHGLAAARADRRSSSGTDPAPGEECPRLTPDRPGLSAIVADALAVLRRAGHDPSAYDLELRSGNRAATPTVVFLPREDPLLYPVGVRPAEPCRLQWVWRPEELTAGQVVAVERARELLRGSAPWPEGQLEDVSVFETADTLTVRLRHARPEDPADRTSESRVTLSKDELRPGAGASRAGR